MNITFITGNKHKAEYLERYLGVPVHHVALDLKEIQSLDVREIVKEKLHAAYEHIHAPVIVEDVSLECEGLGGLPGPFVRFFIERMSLEAICAMVPEHNRRATARSVFGYYDGKEEVFFEGSLGGSIAMTPVGERGYGWDKIFIPDGYETTRANLSPEDDEKTYRQIKPIEALKEFLESKETSSPPTT